ncbi:unnamed protein product [Trichobilharzia szidati]|nr:unnamed protein product [Trichobilharzia szidati]
MLFHRCLRILPKLVHCNYSLAVERSAIDKLRSSNKDVIVDFTAKDGVAFLAMNYQAKKNALSKSFVSSLSEAVKELEMDSKSKVAIVCSLVPGVFCAGADLIERAEVPDKDTPSLVAGLRSLFQRIYLLPMPTIAAIDGAAFGGGLELALACDIRYAGILPKCQLGLIETHWALLPGAGGSQRLPRLIGEAKAKELMYAAARITAEEAEHFGVVNAAIDPKSVPSLWSDMPSLYRSIQYASQVCTKGPIAVRQLKKAVNEGLAVGSLEAGLSVEGQCYRVLVPTKDRKEGMSAFKEKREPVYHGC